MPINYCKGKLHCGTKYYTIEGMSYMIYILFFLFKNEMECKVIVFN